MNIPLQIVPDADYQNLARELARRFFYHCENTPGIKQTCTPEWLEEVRLKICFGRLVSDKDFVEKLNAEISARSGLAT